jgi:hypothetical protein
MSRLLHYFATKVAAIDPFDPFDFAQGKTFAQAGSNLPNSPEWFSPMAVRVNRRYLYRRQEFTQ